MTWSGGAPGAAGQGWSNGVPSPGGAVPGPNPGGPPVCPRHPQTVSYVSCQRCGRPTCPQCQRPAPVGVHCVDCVRASTVRAPRTVFGAPVRSGPPWATITIIALTVLSFVVQQSSPSWTLRWGFTGYLGEHEPYRFLTTALVHSTGSLLHIGSNMLALWVVGSVIEQMFGRWRLVVLYVVSAVGGSVGYLLLTTPGTVDLEWARLVVGASGAIFGLFGAFLIVLKRLRQSLTQVLGIIGINVVIGFVVPNIAWQAHFGGLVTGLAIGAVYAYAPKQNRALISATGAAVVFLLVVIAAVARYASV